MTGRWPVELKDRHTGACVPAVLIERVDPPTAATAEKAWISVFDEEKARRQSSAKTNSSNPQHAHWRWAEKVEITFNILTFQTLGIESEGQIQGLMLVRTAGVYCRHHTQHGAPQVYVELVASAPWNLPSVVERPRFAGVGDLLIRAAIELSIDFEFKGRIGLHSLPQSESWYEDKCGMLCLGLDAEKQNLKYYEMTPAGAEAFLR